MDNIKKRDLYLDMANWSEMYGHYQLADRLRWRALQPFKRPQLSEVTKSEQLNFPDP